MSKKAIPEKELNRGQSMPIGELIANPRNPRVHPPEQIDMLAKSIRRNGQVVPVLARLENKMLISGHGIVTACKQAGLKTVIVDLWDTDQKTANEFMLTANRLAALSHDNAGLVADILKDVDSADYAAIGYTPEEVAQLLSDEDLNEIEVVEVATTPVKDRFWISVRGPLAEQAQTLKRLKEVMQDLPNVEVELGTMEL